MSSIEQLTVLLNEAAESLPAQGSINDEKRNAFYAAYENLRKAIETPIDAAVRVLFGVGLTLGPSAKFMDKGTWHTRDTMP